MFVSQCGTLIDVKLQYIYTLITYLILYLLKYAIGLSPKDNIINISGFTSNNVSISKTTDAIIDVNGKTVEISIHHYDFKIKEYMIYYGCMNMFASWEPKLVMDANLSQKCKDYDIIKHINKAIFYFIYFDLSKYSIKDGNDRDRYS